MNISENPVIFVGAGPGDPELITVKGQKALMKADLVIYAGSLVPEALLEWCKKGTRFLNSASMDLDEIVKSMVSASRAGECVVRLHTGDPSLYGAILEQMEELDRFNIPCKVIPGVTAAFAAAAAMNIEYTVPEMTQTLILTRCAGRTPVPETETLASLAKHQASMAIYLSISLVDEVSRVLSDSYGEDSICAIASMVSQPEEKVIYTLIRDLAETVKRENIVKQALIIVGKSLNLDKTDPAARSKLYSKDFSHGFRQGE